MTFSMKTYIKSLFGDREDSDGTLEALAARLCTKEVIVEIPPKLKASTILGSRVAQTVSLSASQPIDERVIYTADRPVTITGAQLALEVSATVTNTASNSFHVVLNKRGGGVGTYSTTYSVTAYIGAVTSDSGKHGTASYSMSSLQQNVARAPNPLFMNRTAASRQLTKGDVVTLRVDKGSGSADDTGAIFRGGQIKLKIEEN